MKFQDRIDKIINYPANLKEAQDNNNGVFYIVTPESATDQTVIAWGGKPSYSTVSSNNNPNWVMFNESDLFKYPAGEIKPANSTLIEIKTDIWDSKKENILPTEGYFLGYQLNDTRVNFASLMNTPEFSLQFFNDLNSESGNPDISFYYFLHSLPLSPPVPILDTAKPTQNGETFEPNPAILFKNNAGIYSLPEPYVWWLGGISKYRVYDPATIPVLPYIIFDKVDDTWLEPEFVIDDDREYKNHFKLTKVKGEDKLRLSVNTDAFIKPAEGFTNDCVSITSGVYSDFTQLYGVDSLNGIGSYSALFNSIHKAIYGSEITTSDPLLNWNISDKIRTFPTYDYNLAYNKNLTLYASYSVCNFTGISDQDGEISSLVKIKDTADETAKKSSFDLYASVWRYIFHNLSVLNEVKTYSDIVDDIVAYYDGAFTDAQILTMEKTLFDPVTVSSRLPLRSYTDSSPIIVDNDLFSDISELRRFIDLIGLQVLSFIESVSPMEQVDLTNFYVNDPSFTCVLYPSAGGVAGLQYVLSGLSDSLVKGTANGFDIDKYIASSRFNNNQFTATIANIILNSSRFIWGSGPFVGDAPYNMNDVTSYENFGVIGSKLLLNTLDTDFLYDNNIHTKKENRTYILDSDRLSDDRIKSLLRYNNVIDYIGLGALDEFQSKYQEVVDRNDSFFAAKNILLSLLIVDKGDFETLHFNGKDYDVNTQLSLLLTYNVWLTKGFVNGDGFIKAGTKDTTVNMCKIMNASLTQAQTNKIKRVIKSILDDRILFNVGSVFDFGEVISGSEVVTNMFDRALANKALEETSSQGKFIRLALFGNQPLAKFSAANNTVENLYLKYYYRYSMSKNNVIDWANYFFKTIDVAPTVGTVKIAKDFMMLFFKQNTVANNPNTEMEPSFNRMAAIVRGWLINSDKHITACLTSASKYLVEGEKAIVEDQLKDFAESNKDDMNLMKQKSYYNIKALFDNWIRLSSDRTKLELQYSYTHFMEPNSILSKNDLLIDHFMFVDRSNRDVGHSMLANIEWLKTYFENNYGYNNVNTDISLYTFLSELAKQHASLIHALPSFIDFGVYQTGEGKNSARDLFGTFDYVDIADSNPKFLFQFIGNTNSILNTPQNKNLRSASKSYSLLSSNGNKKSNISSNIGNGVNIPKDLMRDGAKAMAFVVDFGEQHQQIFSNLQIDQSEYQNTAEWYQGITQYAKNRTQTQGGDLFSLFTERSYTAQVDSLGNMMIQPLMFFELTNVPLFYGTYWITNVKHTITPNDIKTTFKGVRQPMAILPSKQDVLLELANSNISSLLGVAAINQSSVTNSTGSGSGSGSGTASDGAQTVPQSVIASMDELSFDELLKANSARIPIKNGSEFENNLYAHFKKYNYISSNVPFAGLKAILSLESGGDTMAYNANGGASGIIQFMPSTTQGLLRIINSNPLLKNLATALGINTAPAILTNRSAANNKAYMQSMTIDQQIFFAKVYFGDQRGNVKKKGTTTLDQVWGLRSGLTPWGSTLQLYAAVFFPLALTHWGDPNYVFHTSKLSAEAVAKGNPTYSNDPKNPKYVTILTFTTAVKKILTKRFHLA